MHALLQEKHADDRSKETTDILARYPKTRPPLSPALQEIYTKQYYSNRTGQTPAASFAQRVESWLHRKVARDLLHSTEADHTTLELGAGTLNQLPYEPDARPYDIVEPFTQLFEKSPHLESIRNIYADIDEVPATEHYKRITSVATFEHICNLPHVVAKTGILLATDGTLRVSIPSEGALLWRLSWMLTTGLEFRLRHHLDYGELVAHEHVNTAHEIEMVLRHFYTNVHCAFLGVSRGLSILQFIECSQPIIHTCNSYLSSEKK